MKVCDLTTGSTKLSLAMRTLKEAREISQEYWDDQTSNEFFEQVVMPVLPKIKGAAEGVSRLNQVLHKAERELGDYSF